MQRPVPKLCQTKMSTDTANTPRGAKSIPAEGQAKGVTGGRDFRRHTPDETDVDLNPEQTASHSLCDLTLKHKAPQLLTQAALEQGEGVRCWQPHPHEVRALPAAATSPRCLSGPVPSLLAQVRHFNSSPG